MIGRRLGKVIRAVVFWLALLLLVLTLVDLPLSYLSPHGWYYIGRKVDVSAGSFSGNSGALVLRSGTILVKAGAISGPIAAGNNSYSDYGSVQFGARDGWTMFTILGFGFDFTWRKPQNREVLSHLNVSVPHPLPIVAIAYGFSVQYRRRRAKKTKEAGALTEGSAGPSARCPDGA